MRSDLPKVLCERERRGRGKTKATVKSWVRKFRARPGYEDDGEHVADVPRKVSMTKHLGWERRSFSENLSALEGLVRKNIGRPWSKFYSELSTMFPNTSATLKHIYQHLYDYIAVDCKLNAKGQVCFHNPANRYFGGGWADALEPVQGSWRNYIAYVDPRDDIIKPVKQKKKTKQPSPEDKLYAQGIVRVPWGQEVFRKLGDNWFRVELTPQVFRMRPTGVWVGANQEFVREPAYHDIFKEDASTRARLYGSELYIPTAKRSASKAEIKAYDLRRD